MSSENNCNRCGCKLDDERYNPYNTTFKNHYFGPKERVGEGSFCLKCAEWFLKERNKCKGGHWEIEETQQ